MLKTKSISDPVGSDDGLRLFISVYRPKSDLVEADLWFPELGSPLELIKNWETKKIDWQIFETKYLEQLQSPELQSLLQTIQSYVKDHNLTLLGHARNDESCHRSFLKKYLE